MRSGFSVVSEGVVGPWLLDTFIAAARHKDLDYVVRLPPVEVCQQRVAIRQSRGFTDQGGTLHMHTQFAGSDIPELHLIRDADSRPEAIAMAIVSAQLRGELRQTRR